MTDQTPLQPGPEMDRAVAQVIFDAEPDTVPNSLPPYSTDLPFAMLAAGRMVEKGWDFSIKSFDWDPITQLPWRAEFEDKNKHQYFDGFAPTAPEAICRAILAIGRNTLPESPPENVASAPEGPVTPQAEP